MLSGIERDTQGGHLEREASGQINVTLNNQDHVREHILIGPTYVRRLGR